MAAPVQAESTSERIRISVNELRNLHGVYEQHSGDPVSGRGKRKRKAPTRYHLDVPEAPGSKLTKTDEDYRETLRNRMFAVKQSPHLDTVKVPTDLPQSAYLASSEPIVGPEAGPGGVPLRPPELVGQALTPVDLQPYSNACSAVPKSTFEKWSTSVENIIWNALYVFFQCTRLDWAEGATLPRRPSEALESFYITLFGPQWQRSFSHLRSKVLISSFDIAVALVGATLHLNVFQQPTDQSARSPITFESRSHERCMVELLRRKDVHFAIELQKVAVMAVKEQDYLEEVIRPDAELLAGNFVVILYEHLRHQPAGKSLLPHGMCHLPLVQALSKAFEEALALKAEYDAAGQFTQSHWYTPNVDVDPRRMMAGKHQLSGRSLSKEQYVAFTFLPHLTTRTFADQDVDLSQARVKVFNSTSQTGEIVASQRSISS